VLSVESKVLLFIIHYLYCNKQFGKDAQMVKLCLAAISVFRWDKFKLYHS